MTRITNTILSPNIPNPQYKIYLNGRLTLTLITPNRPSRCVSWNYNPIDGHLSIGNNFVSTTVAISVLLINSFEILSILLDRVISMVIDSLLS